MSGVREVLAGLAEITPAWLRHALVVFVAAASGVVLQAVVDAHGLTAVAWPGVLLEALDTGAWTTATGMLLLVGTPATRQYGVGKHAAGGGGA